MQQATLRTGLSHAPPRVHELQHKFAIARVHRGDRLQVVDSIVARMRLYEAAQETAVVDIFDIEITIRLNDLVFEDKKRH